MPRRKYVAPPPKDYYDATSGMLEAELRRRARLGLDNVQGPQRLTLSQYISAAWRVVDAKPFLPNWHLDALGDILTAAFDGQIRKIVINVPPSFGKSLITSVIAPTWQWGPNGKPQTRFICVSYDETLAQRDGSKSRSLIESDWYQREWGTVFQLSSDQNEKSYYKNDHHGHRLSLGIGGGVGGHRGDVIIIDDPTNPIEAKSLASIMDAQDKWNLTLRSRALEDDSVVILIMQRIHNEDLSGYFLSQPDWLNFRLPALYESEFKCRVFLHKEDERNPHAVPFFEDPRTIENEPLHPARKEASADALRVKQEDPWVFSGQYQQRPVPLEGGSIKHAWLQQWQHLPDHWDDMIVVADMAFKDQEDNSWVVFQCWGRREGDAFLLDQARGHWDFPSTLLNLAMFCDANPRAIAKWVEDKANGPAIISMLKGKLPGLMPTSADDGKSRSRQPPGQKAPPPSLLCLKAFCSMSKEAKLQAVAPYFMARNVFLPPGDFKDMFTADPWLKEYIYEVTNFPKTRFNDQVDCTSMAVWKLLSSFAAHVRVSELLEQQGVGPMVGTMEAAFARPTGTAPGDIHQVAFGAGMFGGSNLARDAFGG